MLAFTFIKHCTDVFPFPLYLVYTYIPNCTSCIDNTIGPLQFSKAAISRLLIISLFFLTDYSNIQTNLFVYSEP